MAVIINLLYGILHWWYKEIMSVSFQLIIPVKIINIVIDVSGECDQWSVPSSCHSFQKMVRAWATEETSDGRFLTRGSHSFPGEKTFWKSSPFISRLPRHLFRHSFSKHFKTECENGKIRLYRKRNRYISEDMPLAGLTDPVDPWQQINLKQELEVSYILYYSLIFFILYLHFISLLCPIDSLKCMSVWLN